MKTALITGITGQDGAYLTELLLKKGYRVYGTYRRTSTPNFWRLQELGMLDHPQLTLLEYDLTDVGSSVRLVEKTEPEEIYNLGAQSFVHVSFDQPQTTAAITGLGPLNVLEAIRVVNPKARFFQASSAEMFGLVQAIPQDETTPFYPRSPYAAAKLYAHWITVNYREAFNIFGCSAILFNHESPLRGREFVTRKITEAVARIKLGQQDMLELGNLSAKRDWGYAPEYVEGMWRMMQADTPDTFVLATNRTETVRNLATLCFAAAGMPIEWEGAGQDEVGRLGNGRVCVRVDPRYHRPSEVELLIGNPAKAREKLGWQTKTRLEDITLMMLDADLRRNGADAGRWSGH